MRSPACVFDGARVRARRDEKGLTVTQLAASVGLNEAAMRRIEANRGPAPRMDVVLRLLGVLDLRFEQVCVRAESE